MKSKKSNKINTIDYNNKNKEYINTRGYNFKIIDKKTVTKITKTQNKRWTTKYLVQFIDTGYEKWAESKEIINGRIKDEKAPYVCGVGVVGTEIKNPQSHILYNRWRDMIRRCYDKKCPSYKTYGERGVTVCDEWLYFPNYVRDIEKKRNYEKLKSAGDHFANGYEIDKDIIKKDNKIYCNEYCSIVSRKENIKERNRRNNYNRHTNEKAVWRISTDFKDIKKFDSISHAGIEMVGKKSTTIFSCICGRQKTALGYYWRRVSDFKTPENAINDIKSNINNKKSRKRYKRKNDYVMFDSKNSVVKEFHDMTIAGMADLLSISKTHFSRCINNEVKYRGEYKIKRRSDL